MKNYMLKPIGRIRAKEAGLCIELEPEYRPALAGLNDFGHINVLWWFSQSDNSTHRANLVEKSPYKDSPEVLGVFATRSPRRPNPIALTCCGITYVDMQAGVIGLDFIDAEDGTPVLDIKPYTPSLDRVEKPATPHWCAGWPQNVETSGDFDWGSVFRF